MDRASDYGSEGWEFKSLRARDMEGFYDLQFLHSEVEPVIGSPHGWAPYEKDRD